MVPSHRFEIALAPLTTWQDQDMEAVDIHIGPLVFDHAEYDSGGDVLYLHRGAPQPAEGEETPEGHILRFAPGTGEIVGLTIINARWLLDRDHRLVVTLPERVEASTSELDPLLDSVRPMHRGPS